MRNAKSAFSVGKRKSRERQAKAAQKKKKKPKTRKNEARVLIGTHEGLENQRLGGMAACPGGQFP